MSCRGRGITTLISFDTQSEVLFREQARLAQLGFPGTGGILAFAPPGVVS
jgi:hypothetical protein